MVWWNIFIHTKRKQGGSKSSEEVHLAPEEKV